MASKGEKEEILKPAATYGAVEKQLPDTDPDKGLTSAEAAKRLEEWGPNELEDADKDSFLKILMTQMSSVIFLLTTVAAILVHLTATTDEDEFKAKFLIGLVIGVCFMNAVGEYSGQDAGAALRAMEPDASMVLRDGEKKKVPVADVVPGDIVVLNIGDVVPADMLVIRSVDLQTNEAILTGEPNEVNKTLHPKEGESAFPTNRLYKATGVCAGSGAGVVTTTGMRTEVGVIAKRLKGKTGKPLCPLQQSVNALGRVIAMCCAGLIGFGMTSSFAMGYQGYPAKCMPLDKECQVMDTIIRGLLMAVTLIPHGLPLVVMIMLRVGSVIMAEKNALVTRQSAVDFLGATNVICTDKTGTLTEGKMAAKMIVGFLRGGGGSNDEAAAHVELAFYPLKGLNPRGRCYMSKELTTERRRALDCDEKVEGLVDLADLTQDAKGGPALLARALAATSFINCWGTKIVLNERTGAWEAQGNMSEGALKAAAIKGHYEEDSAYSRELSAKHKREETLEVPFTSSRKMSATIHELPSDHCCTTLKFSDDHTHFAIVKGAPDRVLKSVARMLEVVESDTKLSVSSKPMTDVELKNIEFQNMELAKQALRSLLMAVRPLSAEDVQKLRGIEGGQERLEFLLSPGPLAFAGLFGIFDPPRASVPPSINMCHEARIRVVMITGDQRPTALAIGKLVGIIKPGDNEDTAARRCTDLHEDKELKDLPKKLTSRLSRQLSVHSDEKKEAHEKTYKDPDILCTMASETSIWSRALPTDKVCIVESLVSMEQVAAMTGDGVNDAPALKSADIGVSMGIAGTAVTKNAADLILMDDNFSTIVAAIQEGRKIYGNVQKYVLFNLSMKASECTCLLIAIYLNAPAPIGGIQQLVNMLFTHIIPPIAIAWEDPEEYTMRIPPRDTKNDLVLNRLLMLHRWLPFVACYGIIIMFQERVWLNMHTGYHSIEHLLPSTRQGALLSGRSACQSAGFMDGDVYVPSALPYHCTCDVRSSPFFGHPYTVDQWGRTDASTIRFDRYSGDTGDAFDLENTPWRRGESSLVKPCEDGNGVTRMCWKKSGFQPTLPSFHCVAWGEKLGQSMTFASIMLGEVCSMVTFRSDGPFYLAKINWVYIALLLLNFTVWISVNTMPFLTARLGLAPLDGYRLSLSLVTPVLLVFVGEVIKINYRYQLRLYHAMIGVRPKEEQNDAKIAESRLGPEEV